ncbi:MAG: outer membrane lipoprotein-sorting protein [Cyclobacteriaceae bacterium]|nr:outer membrane lipoprotein-sorting protein [Cyclobacteriaceae bacterium]
MNRNRIMNKLSALVLLAFTMLVSPSWGQTAKEIVKKADDRMQGLSNKSVMKMTIVRPDWKREITMKGWALGREYSLILITAPARDKGQAFLKRENEMWNWQPSIDRVIKLPPSMMLQSWMGSDFTNDDLVKESSIVNDYDQKLDGDTTINNMSVYKIIMIPKPEAAVVWGKVIVYIDKVNYNEHLVKYYDEDGFLVNTMILSDIKEMGGRIIPTHMEMIPADEPNNKTVIDYLDLQFDLKDITQSFFSLQNMKRIR